MKMSIVALIAASLVSFSSASFAANEEATTSTGSLHFSTEVSEICGVRVDGGDTTGLLAINGVTSIPNAGFVVLDFVNNSGKKTVNVKQSHFGVSSNLIGLAKTDNTFLVDITTDTDYSLDSLTTGVDLEVGSHEFVMDVLVDDIMDVDAGTAFTEIHLNVTCN